MEIEKARPKEVFDRFRSQRAMRRVSGIDYVMVRICGYANGDIIVGYDDERGLIKDFNKENCTFDSETPAVSFGLATINELEFLDIYAKDKNHPRYGSK